MSAWTRILTGASLTRTQQCLILVLGLSLAGLWAWRAGWLGLPSAVQPPPAQYFFVEISGDLPRPGVHRFPSRPTWPQVWEAAGGSGPAPAGPERLDNGSKIILSPEGGVSWGSMSGPARLSLGLPLDLNRASAADLSAIPGIGPVLAERLVAFRAERGQLRTLEDVLQVKGMGPKVLDKIRPYVVIITGK